MTPHAIASAVEAPSRASGGGADARHRGLARWLDAMGGELVVVSDPTLPATPARGAPQANWLGPVAVVLPAQPGLCPPLSVGSTSGLRAVSDRIDAALAAGQRVLLAFDPSRVADAASLCPAASVVDRQALVRQAPHVADPLVADTRFGARGSGPLHGLVAMGAGAGALKHQPEGSVLTIVGELGGEAAGPLAVAVQVGPGLLVVVASASLASDRWVGAADNAAILGWALTGEKSTAVGALSHLRLADAIQHCEPHVVDVGAGPLDTSGSDVAWPPTAQPASTAPLTDAGLSDLLRAARRNVRRLPEHLHDALLGFAEDSHPSGAMLVRGLPTGRVPPTPSDPTAPTGKDLTSELTLLTVARCLGHAVGYEPEHGGDVVQNILPTPDAAHRQTSTSSAVALEFHTEAAFHPHRPRFLLLLCLRGDPAAATLLSSITQVLDLLPMRVRHVLSEPRFRTAVDESYLGERPTRLGAPVPVLHGDPWEPTMTFDADLMVGTDTEADAALAELAAVVRANHIGVVLEAGDMLVVDNAVAVHGRTPFAARFDGTDRWLQRTFVVADLAASGGQRHGRTIATQFIP